MDGPDKCPDVVPATRAGLSGKESTLVNGTAGAKQWVVEEGIQATSLP